MAAEAAAASGGAGWLGPAVLGAALIGGVGQVIAGNKAAKAQEEAARIAAQTQTQMFNRANQINAPYQQAGMNALAMQGSLLGNPNMVPQAAIQDSINPDAKWQAYLQQYKPEIQAYFDRYQKSFKKAGSDWTRAAEKYYNEQGIAKGHAMPTAGSGTGSGGTGVNQTGVGVGSSVDDAYNTFLNSGFGRSALETTNADFDRMIGAYGAGGTSLSGSALIGLNDVNRRNTQGAFNNYYNALSGISGTGAQLGSQQAGNAMQLGQGIANTQLAAGNARASSYMNTANALNSGLQNAGNVLAYGYGNGWFGSGGGAAAPAAGGYHTGTINPFG